MRGLYSVGTAAVVRGALVPWTWIRILRRLDSRQALQERLGYLDAARPAPNRPRLIIHAVSTGEMRAASALVEALATALPDHSIVLTCMTAEARAVAEEIRGRDPRVEACLFLPWDRASAMRRWLDRLRPRGVVVVETEIWPNLFLACRDAGIPVFIASGRVYPRDVNRYRALRPFFRGVLDSVRWLGVQDETAAEAFRQIGGPADRIEVAGNLKYDVPPSGHRLTDSWARSLADCQPLIVAGSTHAPEERWLVNILPGLRSSAPGLRLVLAPRRVQRAAELLRLAARRGFEARAWSAGPPFTGRWDVLVLDQMGWLAPLYRSATVVLAGGTCARRGGHNVIEAAACGRAIIAGPWVSHIRHDVMALAQAGAIVWLQGKDTLQRRVDEALRALLCDTDGREQLGSRARTCVALGQGAAQRSAQRIATILTRSPGSA